MVEVVGGGVMRGRGCMGGATASHVSGHVCREAANDNMFTYGCPLQHKKCSCSCTVMVSTSRGVYLSSSEADVHKKSEPKRKQERNTCRRRKISGNRPVPYAIRRWEGLAI